MREKAPTLNGPAVRRRTEKARLDALAAFQLTKDADDTFDRIARLASERLGCAMAFVSIVDAERQWTKGTCGADAHDRPRGGSFCARVLDFDDVVVVNEPAEDPDWADIADAPHYAAIRFYAAAPLRTDDGYVLGTLCVADTRPHTTFGAEERQALRDLSAVAMDALRLRQALEQGDRVQRRLAESEARQRAILDTAVDAIITITPEGLIQSANPAAERMFGYGAMEMVGRNVSMLMPEPHRSAHDGYLNRYLTEGGPRIIGIGREVPCRRADGSSFLAEMSVSETKLPGTHVFTGILRDQTERRQVEEQLRQHIELVRLAEETAHLGHWRMEAGTNRLFWSDEVYRIHGVTPETYAPDLDSALAFYLPGQRPLVARVLDDTIRTRRPFEFEYTIVRPDGETRIVHSCGRVQTDAADDVVALVGTFQDVTDRVHIEQELKRSQERLERSTTYTNIGIWEWDVISGHIWWSDRIGPMFGLGDGAMAIQYETFLDAQHPDDRKLVEDALTAALHVGAPYEIEHRVLWPDGSVRWLQSRGAVERDDVGQPLRMLGVVQDITRTKEAEQALKESERLLAMSVDNISDGFLLIDDSDRMILWNDRLTEIYPKVAPFIQVGARFGDIVRQGALAGQYAEAVGRIDEWVAERMAQHAQAEENYEERLEDGRWVRIAERRMDNGWRVGIRTDITEIRRAREDAQAANRAKSEFLSKMSHELRTPLNAILGFAQLLEVSRKDPLTAAQQRHVGHIIEGGRHLLELINEILDLARIEAGRLQLSLEVLDPSPVIDDCLGMARTLAADTDITVTSDTDCLRGGAVRLLVDPTRLRQILLNLLSNAVKYNYAGGSVRLSARPVDAGLAISVTDSGPGLSHEAQDRIFEPFNRLGAEGSAVEGAGIGLTITHQLVGLMNGTISIDSRPGAGATFTVVLPLAGPDGEQA